MQRTGEIAKELERALALHRRGDLRGANAIYAQLYAADARDHAAAHGLGLIALDERRPDDALPLLARCAGLAPDNMIYRVSYGLALLAKGQAEDAAAHLLEAANRDPALADARLHLARALNAAGRGSQAVDVLASSIPAFPERADLWALKGSIERGLLRGADAEASLRRALVMETDNAEALNNLGAVLRDAGRAAEALPHYRRAAALAPYNVITQINLGNTLAALNALDEAEDILRGAIARDPDNADARLGLALLFAANERPHDAIPLLREIVTRTPDHADALTNLGVARLATGDIAGAEAAYRDVLAHHPANAEAHYNLAWLLLLTGRWREGWEHYDWRWKLAHFSSRRRGFKKLAWDGAPIAGTLLVHAEQGLGDAIQFARFLEAARERCGHLVFECHRPLTRLLQGISGADEVIAAGDPLPAFERHVPLMSLPGLLGVTPETIPAAKGYLAPPLVPAPLRLPVTGRKRVGLVWAGSGDNKIDRRRSLPARLLGPLMSQDLDFVSLQVGDSAGEAGDLPRPLLFDCAGKVADFADTAAVVAQLDLVIGVDTAVIHLAGAMAKPVWLLLPFMPDYRWLLGRADSPWYASIQLFRQEKSGDWEGLLGSVAGALRKWQAIGG